MVPRKALAERKIRKKKARKAEVKLKRLQKAKKLKRHVLDKMKEIKARKNAAARERALQVEKDWVENRQEVIQNELDDDVLPLDMLDSDIDWEGSAFAAQVKRKRKARMEEDNCNDSIEQQARRFPGAPSDRVRELLPIKVDGKVLRQTTVDEEEPSDDDVSEDADPKNNVDTREDLSHLNAAQLLSLRAVRLEEAKTRIANFAYAIMGNPQEEVGKLKDLINLSQGHNVCALIRESVMKLGTVSLTEILLNIIPGYVIREKSSEELTQKMKKETKKLYNFEKSLLNCYGRYLQHLEKHALKMMTPAGVENVLSTLCLKCICRLMVGAAHFNHATNLIILVIRLTASPSTQAVDTCCAALRDLFSNDLSFRSSAAAAKSIASLVKQKKGAVSPKLLATFLSLKIKEVDKREKNRKKEGLLKKKRRLTKEKKMKSKHKYDKQLKKLEADLKEAEAAESISAKLSNATEAMNHVFATYFRVIKDLPNVSHLEPVLEGLSKFAHLINIEFFDDLFEALRSLLAKNCLRPLESLQCIHAAFVILSGEGVALNIDPSRFYNAMYQLIPTVALEERKDIRDRSLFLILKSLDIMLVVRRKQIPTKRVAAFVKRLLALSLILPTPGATAVLLSVRSCMIAHPDLTCLLEEADAPTCSASFNPEVGDPDCCDAFSLSVLPELDLLSMHVEEGLLSVARHLRKGLPSTGPYRLSTSFIARKPFDWFEERVELVETPSPFLAEVQAFAKVEKVKLASKNMQTVLNKWIVTSTSK